MTQDPTRHNFDQMSDAFEVPLSNDERLVLNWFFVMDAEGSNTDEVKRGLVEKYHPAFHALCERGLLRLGWRISDEAIEAMGWRPREEWRDPI